MNELELRKTLLTSDFRGKRAKTEALEMLLSIERQKYETELQSLRYEIQRLQIKSQGVSNGS